MYRMPSELDVVIQNQEIPDKKGEGEVNLDLGVNKKVKEIYNLEKYRSDLEKRYEEYTKDLKVEFTDAQRNALQYATPAKINPLKSPENTERFFNRLEPKMVAAQEAVAKLMVDDDGNPLRDWAIYASGSIDCDISGKRDDVDLFYNVLDARQISKNLKNSPRVFASKEAKDSDFVSKIINVYGQTHKFSFWIEVDFVDENGEEKTDRVEVEFMGEGATKEGKFAGTGQIGYKKDVEIDQRVCPGGTIANYMGNKGQNRGYALYALKESAGANLDEQKNPKAEKAKLVERLIKFYEKGHKSVESIVRIIQDAVEAYDPEFLTPKLAEAMENETRFVNGLRKIHKKYLDLLPEARDISRLAKDDPFKEKRGLDLENFISTLNHMKSFLRERVEALEPFVVEGSLDEFLRLTEGMAESVQEVENWKEALLVKPQEGHAVLFFLVEQVLSDFLGDFSLIADQALDKIVLENRYEGLITKEKKEIRALYISVEKILLRYRNYSTVTMKKR